jgi:hypothetical protein
MRLQPYHMIGVNDSQLSYIDSPYHFPLLGRLNRKKPEYREIFKKRFTSRSRLPFVGCPIFCTPIMPPKPGPSNEGPRKLKFGLFGDRRSKNTIPDPTTSRVPPSAGGESNSQRAIRNARLALDALGTASDISEVLGPLKILCFALKVVVDTAEVGPSRLNCAASLIIVESQGVVQNNEGLTKLREKLKRQLSFVEDKTKSLADPRFRPSRAAVQGLVKSLQDYTSCVSLWPNAPVLTETSGS